MTRISSQNTGPQIAMTASAAVAASTVAKPWFAIGGLDAGNVHEVIERGATRIVVVRAITEAEDPEAAARELRAALEEPARA